jgi:hypothetical protein
LCRQVLDLTAEAIDLDDESRDQLIAVVWT